MQTPIRSLAAPALVALLVTGCSGGGDDEDPRSAPSATSSTSSGATSGDVDEAALRDGLVGLWVGDDRGPEDTATGECFADALLAASTPEDLRAAGILDDTGAVVAELPVLDEQGAGLWVDAQLACTDFVAESTRAQVAATKGKVDRTAYTECLRDALSEEEQRAAAIASLQGDLSGDAVAALSQAQLTCVQQALPPD
ncbi:hypothetical protein [Nocardioides sp. 503]|uniref:hypothetical protein n=1 Tax=Nocardioides sp. 503 TaxID=2508326 RepID=UPI00106FB2A1|nr:hypothetical protein [Nocardioides sp. 503]